MANKNVQLKNGTENVYPIPHYPIGAVYMSYTNTSPATLFGGVWQQIKDVFLYAGTKSNTTKQGVSTHKLTLAEMPSHSHTFSYNNSNTSGSGNKTDSYQNAGSSTTTLYTSYATGSGGAHENMPPYLAVYMWRKVGHGTEPAESAGSLDNGKLDNFILG